MYIEAMQERGTENMDDTASSQAILESLERSKQGADTMVCKGIEAIVQSARGVPRPDIARSIGVSVNSLRAYISVARKHLKQNQQFQRRLHESSAKTMGLCVCSFLIVYMLFSPVILPGYVPSASMEPTIRQGSYIFGTRLIRSLAPGDIIIFRHGRQTLTKRIAYGPAIRSPAAPRCQTMSTMSWGITVQCPLIPGHGTIRLSHAMPSSPNTYFEVPFQGTSF